MVTILSSHEVIPSEPTPIKKLPSSYCEQCKLRTHAPLLYIYKTKPNIGSSKFSIEILKSSLSKALVPYYPLAGRLCWVENGGGRWELHCNANGAKLLEAKCESSLDNMGDFAPAGIVKQLIPNIDYGCPIEEVPLLAAQITRFSCGGVAVGAAFCRAVIDGPASMRVMNSWAKLARGEHLDLSDHNMPIHDRDLLNSRRLQKLPRFEHSEFQLPPIWLSRLKDSQPESSKNSYTEDLVRTGISPVVAVLKLSNGQVKKLKKKVNDPGNIAIQRPYTSFEVVAGHLWRCLSKARYEGNGEQPTRLMTLANCRNRLRPPLPDSYAGNAAFPTVTPTCSFRDLTQNPLSYAVGNVRLALERLNDEYVSSALDYAAYHDDLNLLRYNFHYPAGSELKGELDGEFKGNPNLFVVSWMNFTFKDADFGWGQPVYCGPGFMDSEGKAFLLNDRSGDGLVVAICLLASHMDSFKKLFYEDIEEVFTVSKL